MGRPDAPVFPPEAEVHPDLLHPFPDAADSRPDGVNLWDEDHGAARRGVPDMADAIPEGPPGLMALGAEKLAVPAPAPADVVPDRPAWVWSRALPASDDLAAHWRPRALVAAEQCKPDAGPSAA